MQCYRWEKEQSQNLWIFHPDMPDQLTLSQLHCHRRQVFTVSVQCWNNTPIHKEQKWRTNSTITVQEVSLATVKDQNACHIFYKHGENPQRICDWRKDSEFYLLVLERLLKQIWTVRNDSERKTVGPFCTTMSPFTLTWQWSTPWQTVTWRRPATHHIHLTSHQ